MERIELQSVPAAFLPVVERAANGATIVICNDHQPIVEMRPMAATVAAERPVGLGAGKITILPGFFEPLPDDVLRDFNGGQP